MASQMTNHYSLRIISLSLLLNTSLSTWDTFFCRIQPFLAFCLWPHWFLTCLSLCFGTICINDSDQTKTLYKWYRAAAEFNLYLPMPWMWTSNCCSTLLLDKHGLLYRRKHYFNWKLTCYIVNLPWHNI